MYLFVMPGFHGVPSVGSYLKIDLCSVKTELNPSATPTWPPGLIASFLLMFKTKYLSNPSVLIMLIW